VQIKIHVDILFRVSDPHAFVYDIGPEKLEELLRASQAESVRSLVRSIKVSEAYDLRGQESEDMVNSLNDKVKPYGVQVEQITIANVTLPASIAVAMQSETTFESKQTEQRKKQEYELKVLNDSNYLLRVKQDRENERKRATQESTRLRTLIIQEIKSIETNMDKVLNEIEASEASEVSKIQADGRTTSLKFQAEKDRVILEVKAQGDRDSQKLKTEMDKYVREVKSQAKVVVAQNNAKATEVIGDAEQKAAEKLKVRRKFDLELEQVEIWNQLAKNQNVFITGDSENSLMSQMYNFQQISNLVSKTAAPQT